MKLTELPNIEVKEEKKVVKKLEDKQDTKDIT